MTEYRHKIFSVNTDKGLLAIIPSLDKYFLFNKDTIIPAFIFSDKPNFEKVKIEPSLQMVLILTNKCNLACTYCYEVGDVRNIETMSIETIDIVFKNINEIAIKSKIKNLRITFFGGEPTLAWEQLQYSLKKIENLKQLGLYNIKSTIVTNGYINNKDLSTFKKIDNISVSIDGYPKIQNQNRPTIGGHISSTRVLETINYIYKNFPDKLSFRITVTSDTLNLMNKIADYFFSHFPKITQCYEPHSMNKKSSNDVTTGEFLSKYFELLTSFKYKGERIKTSLFSLKPKMGFCGLQNRMVIYPNGIITSCHRVDINNPDDKVLNCFKVGEINNGYFPIHSKRELNLKTVGFEKGDDSKCDSCFAKYYCRGGCPAIKVNNGQMPGDNYPNCEVIKQFYIKYFQFRLNLN